MEQGNKKLKRYKALAIVNVVLGLFSLWFIGILLGIIALFNLKRARAFSQTGSDKKARKSFKNIVILFVITILLVGLNIYIFTSYIQEIGGWDQFLFEMKQSTN